MFKKLADLSGVPYATIRKFESSGNISFRQFLMLKSTLTVKRTLSTGEKVLAGKLVENSKQSIFQFDETYLDGHSSFLAPFNLYQKH